MTQKRTAPDWGKYSKSNRRHWDEIVSINVESEFYDVASFRTGKTKLKPVELSELGEVRGKSLLHLQCHFGLDTLSWAREGAIVTGVDFSERAVEAARNLAAETEIDARFVLSDIYSLPKNLRGEFDIVFTSYGALGWLPDIRGWAEVVAHFIKPGGTFYVVEFHPFAFVFDDAAEVGDLKVRYPYFPAVEPLRSEVDGSYADPSAHIKQQVTYQWPHTLGDIVSALTDAGLLIEFLHEFPFSTYQFLPFTEKQPDGTVRLKKQDGCVPLLYSIKASKPVV